MAALSAGGTFGGQRGKRGYAALRLSPARPEDGRDRQWLRGSVRSSRTRRRSRVRRRRELPLGPGDARKRRRRRAR